MSKACPRCSRRAWLLGRLGVPLDFRARDLPRFWNLLGLPDRELIEAIGGRRRSELHGEYRRWTPTRAGAQDGITSTCVHTSSHPQRLLATALAPRALSVRGGIEPLGEMLARKVVAIAGTRRATDYGIETARELARALAACGVTVAGALDEGIAAAAHTGALEAGGRTLTVMGGGLERCSPAWCGALYDRILREGCAVAELVDRFGSRVPRWWQPGRARTLALLADLVIVVEAQERPWELACAHVARERGTPVAAVPGRVSSPASAGSNALLAGGATLVRGAQDALDALYGLGAREAPTPAVDGLDDTTDLDPRLARVLDMVGDGRDTPAKLASCGDDHGEIAVALIELELAGLLVRGDGGRYVPSSLSGAGHRVPAATPG